MVRLTAPFSRLKKVKILVAGDLLLDTYTIGKARRISPEAPVAVVHVQKEEHRAGGAGNVILNLVALGAEVVALGRTGADTAGDLLLNTLGHPSVSLAGVVRQGGLPTPVKNRIIAENQQIVRVDRECTTPLTEQLEQQLIENLPILLQDVDVVAISDYGKGFLTPTLLKALIHTARECNIAIIADPKGINFAKYALATVLKPNLGEAYAAANLPLDAPLELVAEKVLQLAQCGALMVTRSEAGISLFYQEGHRHDFPVQKREVKDVTGAGDTVLAMLACALASGLSIAEAAQLSNIAAGIAIERLGCAQVTLSDIARRLLESDVVNKIFDEEHLFALQQALHGRPFTLLGISGAKGLSSPIFGAIRQLSHKEGRDLVVYVTDPDPSGEFISLLSSLNTVDFILVEGHSLRSLVEKIHPDAVYEVREGALIKLDHALDLIL